MKKRQIVIHPYLFALYPVVTLLASNLDQISPGIGLRSALLMLSVAVLLTLLFWVWMKDIKKAGLAVTLILFLIFSFRHIISLLEEIWRGESLAVVNIILLTVFLISILIGPWLIWRFVRSTPDMITTFLNIVAMIIVIFPLVQIGGYLLNTPSSVDIFNAETTSVVQKQPTNSDLPDVYYIIVDGYGRSDILQEIYNLDNSNFLNQLTDRGFYIADQSSTNYMQTYLSLSSSLNYNYLDSLAENLGEELDRRDPLTYLIQNNQVRKTLEEVGYETVIYDSGWPAIDSEADTVATNYGLALSKNRDTFSLNTFESLLWRNTVFNDLIINNPSYDNHRQLILDNFAGLKASASLEGPQFIIGHVIAPHPPFVFAANGEFIQPNYEYSIHDGNAFVGTPEEYLVGYANQLSYINTLLLDTIDTILDESEQPPIIIIQGDHGPGSTLDFDVLENNSCYKERFAILNAYYFPDGDYDALYESITPVNSFRVVLNNIVDADLELVADKNYFSLWNTPYDFVDVTDDLTYCELREK